MTSRLQTIAAKFTRPADGVRWTPGSRVDGFHFSGRPAWHGNGGPTRGHPWRSLPFSVDVPIPQNLGVLRKVHIAGIFALCAESQYEAPGTIGATLQFMARDQLVLRQNLLNGRHYADPSDHGFQFPSCGDGITIRTVGKCDFAGELLRVDMLTFDMPHELAVDSIRFKDLGSSSSFVIFDVFFDFEEQASCPFSPRSKGISLGELASIVRLGDRVRFEQALRQFGDSVTKSQDLEEARGFALTFLAIIAAAALDVGGGRVMHRALLDCARDLEKCGDRTHVRDLVKERVLAFDLPMHAPEYGPSARLIDKALSIVDKTFARDLTDAIVAQQLGLSTSHFRYLFRKATGQPFNKYLTAIRLEKAREMLISQRVSVSQVAEAVGFTGMAHFSRAFSSRFSVTPTMLKRAAFNTTNR